MKQVRICLSFAALLMWTGMMFPSSLVANDFGSKTKAEALRKAADLGCLGAYEWEGVWMPCAEDNEGPDDDHSGHDHSHDHDH
jgi:hypothetical protein